MDKFAYIVKTLARTRRKDYENYVVNAVWQRLGDPSVKPVTQQLVRCADGRRRFIDLYFPQVAFGVECDEGYHRADAQRLRDEQRTVELIDAIRQIDESSYTQLRVDVGGKTLEEVDARGRGRRRHPCRGRGEAARGVNALGKKCEVYARVSDEWEIVR